MNTTDTRASVAPTHPARSTEGYISSFGEWLEEWDKNRKLELRLGLLHALTLHDHCWKFPDTHVVLLKMADGHDERYSFGHESEPSLFWHKPMGRLNPLSASEARNTLARKAFLILCDTVFKQPGRDETPEWVNCLNNPQFLSYLVWFLRPESDALSRPFNLPRGSESHASAAFRDFLISFAEAVWVSKFRYRRQYEDWNIEIVQRIEGLKLESLVWLSHLGSLHRLNEFSVPDSMLCELEKALLGLEYDLPQFEDPVGDREVDRRPRSLDEIIHLPLAQFVVTRRIQNRNERQNEAARQQMVARQKRKEAIKRAAIISERMKELKKERKALEKA